MKAESGVPNGQPHLELRGWQQVLRGLIVGAIIAAVGYVLGHLAL
jgi:hypothetical protein